MHESQSTLELVNLQQHPIEILPTDFTHTIPQNILCGLWRGKIMLQHGTSVLRHKAKDESISIFSK